MDIAYILFNSLIYGIVAFVMMSFFAYFKILNFAAGAFMIFLWYILEMLYVQWINWITIAITVSVIIVYILINRVILRYFKNIKQRELFGLVFTLWASILIENVANYIFGPNAVSIWNLSMNTGMMITIFILLNIWVFYFLKLSFVGKLFKWIFENANVVKSLWFRSNRNLQIFGLILLVILWIAARMILIEWNIRSSDALFYLIKWVGIMILVGIKKIEYVFIWSLLYVCLEYLLFIKLGLPIAYKETLILIVMLTILIFKPNGIFTRKSLRKS